MLPSIEIPLRDTIRIVVGGFIGALCFKYIAWRIEWKAPDFLDLPTLVLSLGLMGHYLGLMGHYLVNHCCCIPFFCKPFQQQMAKIYEEIATITGLNYDQDHRSEALQIFQVWFEAICEEKTRAYLHYTSS